MKKTILSLCAVIIILSITACGSRNIDDRAAAEAEAENKNCPVMVDDWTRLDSAKYDRNARTLTYYYSVTGQLDDQAFVDSMKPQFRETQRSAVLNQPSYDPFLKAGIGFKFIFLSSKEKGVIRFENEVK